MDNLPLTRYGSTKFGSKFFLRQAVRLIDCSWFSGLAEIALLGDEVLLEMGTAKEYVNCTEKDFSMSGFYFFETDHKLPWIGIYLREVYKGVPFPFSLTPVITILIGRVLAHEVVHHRLRQSQRVILDSTREEVLAEAFARRFEIKICRNWWFRIWRSTIETISKWHFISGSAHYRSKDFQKAEQSFYNAWLLDNGNIDAATWFWQVRGILQKSEQHKQPTSPRTNAPSRN